MVAKEKVPIDPAKDVEFDKAFELLSKWFDFEKADQMNPVRSNAVYTTSVVLWMLVYQRMNPDASLEAAVKKLIDSKPAFLPANKRVTEGTLSTNTSAYCQARNRLPREVAHWFAEQVSQSLIAASTPSFGGQRVFMLDGTTITLAPEDELRDKFPAASNQYGEGVWPVALLVVAHELASGAALLPEVGAMYGEYAVSETALVHSCLRQLPAKSIVMADAGYGIFAVAHETHQADHDFVFRMTKQRFESLRKKAEVVASGNNWKTYAHSWRPSSKERKNHSDLAEDVFVNVSLHEIVINDHLTLYLVTSLPDSAEALADLYERRIDVEVDIRNLKVVLDTENIRARSVEMFHKELLTSVVAYNLVTQFRRQAAELANQPPRRMSFKRTWTTFRTFLLSAMYTDPASWREKYRTALGYAIQDKLPNRPGRKFEREAYKRRPKSAQFKKRKPKSTDQNVK